MDENVNQKVEAIVSPRALSWPDPISDGPIKTEDTKSS
jgi:hypothetical protein